MSRDLPDSLQSCPAPSEQRISLRVTAAAEGTLRHGHPWLYDQAIRKQSREGRAGDLAVIFDRNRKFLAIGLYDPTSPLRVRVLQVRKPAPIDRAWFRTRLAAAVQRRKPLDTPRTTGYRLVHGENDGLPGLVVDRYDNTLVLKLYTLAWVPHLRDVLPALRSVWPFRRLVLRLSRAMAGATRHLYGLSDGMILSGPSIEKPVIFYENGLQFEVDPVKGQKTGFFLDQRDNRARIEQLCSGKSVLDAFAYTGGFSIYAARGGAREVTSLDASRPALAAAQRNMALNRDYSSVAAATHRVICDDVFQVLARLRAKRARYDLVIIDPPAFAKTHAEVQEAMAAYHRLAQLGLGVLRPEGLFMMASCSSHVSEHQFFKIVHRAAEASGRRLQETARTGHALDHPITFPEGAYLKCVFGIASGR